MGELPQDQPGMGGEPPTALAALPEPGPGGPPDGHYWEIVDELVRGRVIPLLGAGVNLCDRPRNVAWRYGEFLPSGAELACELARVFRYPANCEDLLRVSQYAAVKRGDGALYEELHRIFDADYRWTRLHNLLAKVPGKLRALGHDPPPYQLIVTTNYDDALERAFRSVGEPYDLVSYMADEDGRFLHRPWQGSAVLVDDANSYTDVSTAERTVILKLHGAVDRENQADPRDSYVITEDDYFDYLTRTDISKLVPVHLAAKLSRSHFLMLGYSLGDWNVRVILHRIWTKQRLKYRTWSIQLNTEEIERDFWRERGVQIYDVPLDRYTNELAQRLDALEPDGQGG
jgi:SIR2-like domain